MKTHILRNINVIHSEKNNIKMKNITLILFIFYAVHFLSAQPDSSDHQSLESYVLTREGEKISISPGEDITYNTLSKKIEYCTKVKYQHIAGDSIKHIQKASSIKVKNIDKIVDGNLLYKPFTDDKGKLKLCRIVAKNKEHILGHYIVMFDSRGSLSGNLRTNTREYFVILDHNYKRIKEREIYNKDYTENTKSIDEIKELFNSCLQREDLFDPIERKFVDRKPPYKKKVVKIKIRRFLYTVNQLACD